MSGALKAFSVTVIVESPGEIGYRTGLFPGPNEAEAISAGMLRFANNEPDKSMSKPAAIEITADRLRDIGVDIGPQWHPIETAPKAHMKTGEGVMDAPTILIYQIGEGVCTAKWCWAENCFVDPTSE